MKTITVWKKKEEFKSVQDHNQIELDGNKEKGFSPKALLLSALAACSGIDVVEILEKMRVKFSDLEIDAEAEQTTEHPKVFKEIMLTYRLRADVANQEKIKKAIELSLEKYCGVSAMLKKNSTINYTIVLKH
jgi:putative redox protein